MISIAVEKAAMEIENREALTAGMVNTVRCMFTFSDDWDGLDRIFVFTDEINTINVIPEGNSCTVPHEVLTTPGQTVMVGVYGTDGENITLPTVWGTLGIVQEGTDPSGDESTDPALPVWSQILAMIGQTEDLATKDKTSLVAAINEAAKSGGSSGSGSGTPGEDGATFIPSVSSDGVISWTNDKGLDDPEPVSIMGPQGEKGDTGPAGADGSDGVSVTVASVKESAEDGGSNVVTFSDGKTLTVKNGSTGAQGEKGEKGDTGATGPEGPRGEKGESGPAGSAGADGVSVTHSWNGTTLTVTSASGTSSADLKGEKGDTGTQGEKGDKGEKGDTGATGAAGADGKDGADGYTPVKGTDYWTADDKAEMVNDVLAALPTWTGGSY